MDRLKMHTPDLTQENIAKLAELFPNCVTEARDEQGRVKQAIDFDLLRQELSDHVVEGPQERYHLNWPGKREALLAANAPIAKTLRPCREESVDFDKTKNLFIEGDNLDALKLLQETYLNKVKMIYIDPPYNTGNDFLYDDDFRESTDEYLQRSNQRDELNARMVTNTESNGRFHSDWLSMMLPRLRLARSLLHETGLLFISISDHELATLKLLCDEIFGIGNFVGQITWKARVKPVNIGEAKYRPQREVEYVLIYQRQASRGQFLPLITGGTRSYPNEIDGRRYRLATILKSNRGTNYRSTMSFPVNDFSPPEGQRWQAGEDVIQHLFDDGYIEFRDGTPFRRYFEDEEGAEHDPFYCFMETEWSSTSEAGKHELNRLIGDWHDFDTVKPVRLLRTLIESCVPPEEDAIILDFFSGSATTAHAAMELVASGSCHRWIMVQLPEPCDPDSRAYAKGLSTIAEIGKTRIRAAVRKIRESFTEPTEADLGFRVLKIDSSNMKDVYYRPDEATPQLLGGLVDNIKEDRTDEDLLFQVMLDWGVDLSLPIAKETIAGKPVYFVDGNALAACFAPGVTDELVTALAKREPSLLRVVFRDAGYGSDEVKINATQIFKQFSPGTDVKTL